MAPSYQMPGWMQRSLGMGAQEVPFSPMVGLPTQQSRTPNRDLLMARALASGGNTDPGNENAINRVEMMNIQAAARRQLADMAFQEQMAYRNEVAKNAMLNGNGNGNGMRDGVAYMNGQPVGFRGAVPSIRPGIPEAGFTGGERNAYQQELMRRISGRPAPMATGQVPVMQLAAPAPVQTEKVNGRDISYTGELSTLGRNEMARRAMGVSTAPQGQTITARQESKANTDRGTAARKDLDIFVKSLPTVLPEVAAEAGIEVDEDVLAETILAEAEMGKQMGQILPVSTPTGFGFGLKIAQRLKVDPKVLIRWAQDRKKK